MTSNRATSQKNIVIIGGSYGGVSTAHNLLKHAIPKLPNKETYQVIVVSASARAMCRPACPRALISDDLFPQNKLFVSVSKQFEQYPKQSFRFIHGSATKLDHTNHSLTVSLPDGTSEKLNFHALVIATGGRTTSPLFSMNEDSISLRSSWIEFREVLPSAKSIVIAGGGPTGVETAGELGEHLNGRAGWFRSKLQNPKVSITVVTAGDQVLPLIRTSLAKKAEAYLATVGVTVIKNTRVTSVQPEGAGTADNLTSPATITMSDGKTMQTDLYVPAVGTQPNTAFIDKSLLTSDGRVSPNPSTLRVQTSSAGSRIYAIGDCASYSRPAIHLMMEAIPVLCSNIKRDLLLDAGVSGTEVPKERTYEVDTRETQLVPIGKSRGVGAAMGWSLPSWVVWAIKGRDYWLWTTGPVWSGKQWAKEK